MSEGEEIDMEKEIVKDRRDPKMRRAMIAVVEDDGFLGKKDKNTIYNRIKEDIADIHPELAEYVTGQMKRSLTLEEANLIGETALVVYRVTRHFYVPKNEDPNKQPPQR